MGALIGIVPIILILSGGPSGTGCDIHRKTSCEVLPNAEGKRAALQEKSPLILKLNISGIIGAENITARNIETILQESQEEPFKEARIKGILLVVDSPGGTVFDADRIYRLLKQYKERHNIPIYAYIDGICASGGFYIAAAADKIFASDTSLIGSIGVILNSFVNISQLLEDYGVKTLTVSAGKGKDNMNPLRPWTEGEEEDYRVLTNYYYMQFIDVVVNGRPQIDADKLIYEYGAHVFPAPVAQEYGFIDESSVDYDTALTTLVEATGTKLTDYQVIELTPRRWWTDFVRGEFALLRGQVTHRIELAPGVDSSLMNQFLYLYQPR